MRPYPPPAGMRNLRSQAIRLAHSNPGRVRTALLPILAKSEFEEQFDSASKLDGVDPALARVMVESGLQDGGEPGDDKIAVSKSSWSAAELKPSQTSIVLGKVVGMAIGMLISNKIGGDLGAIVSSDGYIMDGHHRWAATILASGKSGKVGGYKADLKGPDLVKVLNILTKGLFGVGGGKAGKGAISDLTPAKVKAAMEEAAESGISGEFPISAEKIQKALEKHFGSVEEGVEEMAANAKLINTSTPGWAPDRKQMPVIEPEQVPEAAKALSQGVVDWNGPFKQAALRSATIRLAHDNPGPVRAALLPILKKVAIDDDFHDKRLLKLVSSAANSTKNGRAADARDYIDQALLLLKDDGEFITFPDPGHVRAQMEFAREALMGLDPRRTALRPLHELKTSLELHQRSRTAGKIVPVKGPVHIGDAKVNKR